MWRLAWINQFLVILVSLLWSCSQSALRSEEVVRIITWNLKWFPGGTPTASQEQQDRHFLEIAGQLPQWRPDVLILQEIRDIDTANRLAKLMPDFKVHVVSQFRDAFGGGIAQQQMAILSRYDASEAWAEPWKKGWANAPRGYVYAALKVHGNRLHVYGLHLKSNLGDPDKNTAKREDACLQLLDHIAHQTVHDDGVVIGGDFNSSEDIAADTGERTFRLLGKAGFYWSFQNVPFADRITIQGKGRYPDASFDHIYVRNLGKPIGSVISGSTGSDHYPVQTLLHLKGLAAP